MTSDRYELADSRLHGQLSRKLRAWRRARRSYGWIARELATEGVEVHRTTVDRWCQELAIPANPVNAAKAECLHGHPFTEKSTYRRPNGKRECRICNP